MSSNFQFGAKNGSPVFGNLLFDRCRHSPGRTIVVLFTTQYALPRQLKPRILELSIRRRQSNSSIVLTFVGCKEIDCYHDDVISAGQLGMTTAGLNHYFAVIFSISELGGITKHLMTCPLGNSEFCFPSTSMFPSALPRGTLRVSGKQNSLFPLGPVIKCLLQ